MVVAAARSILMSNDGDRSKLVECGGHIKLNRQWAYHLLGRMNFVRRKATTSKSKQTPQNFSELKETFLNDTAAVIGMEEIILELVLNWD